MFPSSCTVFDPLERVRAGPPQKHVEAVVERPLGRRRLRAELRHEAIPRFLVPGRVEIGSDSRSGLPGKYIEVTSRFVKARPKTEKWMCGAATHSSGCARDGRRLDRREAISAVGVGKHAAQPKLGSSGARMLVDLVRLPAGRVRLPDLDQGVADRATVAVDDPPVTMIRSASGSPANWRVKRCGAREVEIAVGRARQLRQALGQRDERQSRECKRVDT